MMVFNKSSRVATATTPFDFTLFPSASPGPPQQHTFLWLDLAIGEKNTLLLKINK